MGLYISIIHFLYFLWQACITLIPPGGLWSLPGVPLWLPQLGTVKVHGTQCLGPACTACMCNLISPYSVVFFSLFLVSLMLFSSPLFILYPLTLHLPPATDLIPTFTVPSPSPLTPKGRWQRSQFQSLWLQIKHYFLLRTLSRKQWYVS